MVPTDEEWWRARQVNDLDGWIPWQQMNEPDATRLKQRIQTERQKRTPEGDRELRASLLDIISICQSPRR